MATATRTNRFINIETGKKPTRASRNNSPKIIAKDKNMNKSTFIEEANETFKELPSNIKQEIRLCRATVSKII